MKCKHGKYKTIQSVNCNCNENWLDRFKTYDYLVTETLKTPSHEQEAEKSK